MHAFPWLATVSTGAAYHRTIGYPEWFRGAGLARAPCGGTNVTISVEHLHLRAPGCVVLCGGTLSGPDIAFFLGVTGTSAATVLKV